MRYFDELKRSMEWLAEKPDTYFLGQAVGVAGTAMRNTLVDIDPAKLKEMPVNEDMQMGITNGMALNGSVPISIFPRWNFLVLASNQLINHLDKFQKMWDKPTKSIIRVGVGSERPLHPQHQHVGDMSSGYRVLLPNVHIVQLLEPDQIFELYKFAYERKDGRSTILVEYGDFYNEK